jgi:RNA polymerase sigma-70 factor, ECF subfamily
MTRLRAAGASDRELADAVVNGGAEWAFRELYQRHAGRVFQLVVRLLGGAEPDAQEIVQEAWLDAAEGLAGFRWQSSFHTWLTAIALNKVRTFWRQADRTATAPLPEDLAATTPPIGLRLDLEAAIARLPEGARAVLVLHDIEGFTHDEIGRLLGIAAGTSKSQLFDARRRLRHQLRPADATARGPHPCEPCLKTS